MGIGSEVFKMLETLKQEGYLPSNPAVLEIGAQQLSNGMINDTRGLATLQKLFGTTGVYSALKPPETDIVHGKLQHLHAEAPAARDWWKWLGFQYAAIDIDGSEGSIPLDLNFDGTPEEHKGKYNLVTNFGTTEHIVNQFNAFKVIHELTAHYGVMAHMLPAQGMMNHGLVNYNPKFFWMLARSNGYLLVSMNYRLDNVYYPLPENILEQAEVFDDTIRRRSEEYKMADSTIVCILQKIYDTPFVPPLDVPTGTPAMDDIMKERYWSVFKKDAFAEHHARNLENAGR